MILGAVVFVFSVVLFISIIDSDIGLFAGWRCTDSEYLFVGLMHDELFDPTTMQRGSPQSTISETADAINQSAKQALEIVTLDPQSGGLKAEFIPESTTGGAGDKLHPNRTGYLAMGMAIDLNLFKP